MPERRYNDLLRRVVLMRDTAAKGCAAYVFATGDDAGLDITHRILSLPEVPQLPAVRKLLEEVQG